MSIRETTCKVVVCDACGDSPDGEYGTVHFDSDSEARDEASNHDWLHFGDRDVCEHCYWVRVCHIFGHSARRTAGGACGRCLEVLR